MTDHEQDSKTCRTVGPTKTSPAAYSNQVLRKLVLLVPGSVSRFGALSSNSSAVATRRRRAIVVLLMFLFCVPLFCPSPMTMIRVKPCAVICGDHPLRRVPDSGVPDHGPLGRSSILATEGAPWLTLASYTMTVTANTSSCRFLHLHCGMIEEIAPAQDQWNSQLVTSVEYIYYMEAWNQIVNPVWC